MIEVRMKVEKYGTRKRWMAVIKPDPKQYGYVLYSTFKRGRMEDWLDENEQAGRIKVIERL